MILHVENLRRVYTKEHAELLELRETLMQNERSFGSHTERGSKRTNATRTGGFTGPLKLLFQEHQTGFILSR